MKPRQRSAETIAERPGRDAITAFDHAAEQLLDAAPLEGLAEHVATLRRLFIAELYP